MGVMLGYGTLLDAVFHTLNLLMVLRGFARPQESAHSFILTALDAIPRTATIKNKVTSEADLVAMIEMRRNPHNFEPSFCAAVLCKWCSSAVAGVLQAGVAAHQKGVAAFDARQRADIEKIGLRECAWPSCDKVERIVREFKQCSGCRSVWYCSPEHHTLDWAAHKKDCQKLDKARRAVMAAGGEAPPGTARRSGCTTRVCGRSLATHFAQRRPNMGIPSSLCAFDAHPTHQPRWASRCPPPPGACFASPARAAKRVVWRARRRWRRRTTPQSWRPWRRRRGRAGRGRGRAGGRGRDGTWVGGDEGKGTQGCMREDHLLRS